MKVLILVGSPRSTEETCYFKHSASSLNKLTASCGMRLVPELKMTRASHTPGWSYLNMKHKSRTVNKPIHGSHPENGFCGGQFSLGATWRPGSILYGSPHSFNKYRVKTLHVPGAKIVTAMGHNRSTPWHLQ